MALITFNTYIDEGKHAVYVPENEFENIEVFRKTKCCILKVKGCFYGQLRLGTWFFWHRKIQIYDGLRTKLAIKIIKK